ncbi:MAG TPA: copper-binding protein [Thermoanaerobaculia bacterium]|nr:copper-binding protein [Thermoanaerobaculia bacterium]
MRRIAFVLLLALLVACGRGETKQEKVYTMKGTIIARDAADNMLRVNHEEIPGYMEAMTMDYTVKGAKVTELPPDNARVEGKLHVSDEGAWLTDVKKVR